MYTIEPLSPPRNFGAIVRGISAADIETPEQRKQLRDLWADRGLLVFKDTQNLTTEFHVALSRVFGDLQRHHQENMLVDGHPELISFRADGERDGVYEVDGELRSGFFPFHSDFRWMDHPNRGGVLRIVQLPEKGGDTGFVDGVDAYESMPEDLKRRIEGREVVYQMMTDDRAFKFERWRKMRTIRLGSTRDHIRDKPEKYPPAAYPLVITLPETGRKFLSYSPYFALSVIGLSPEESDALLFELADYYTDPKRAYFHKWELGDMVLWDNWRMLHSAEGVPLGEEREGQRTTIAGAYPIGRMLGEGGWKFEQPLQANLDEENSTVPA